MPNPSYDTLAEYIAECMKRSFESVIGAPVHVYVRIPTTANYIPLTFVVTNQGWDANGSPVE